jgi:tetratricopeptide (TPR) repeat protein
MNYSFPTIILVILLYSCTSANDYLQKANIAIEKKNYREAIDLLNKALGKENHFREAYTEKAHCYAELNMDDSAIIVYKQLIAFNQNNTLALYNIGLCKYRQEKFDEAISYFNNAMITKGYNPDDTSGSQFIMEYSPFIKKFMGKEDKFEVPFSDLVYMAGLSHFEAGHLKKAYHYFTNCISWEYHVGESYYMIGLIWLASKKKDKACESFINSYYSGYLLAKEQLDKTCK